MSQSDCIESGTSLKKVSVEDMANAREKRVFMQKKLIQEFSLPVVSFMLNIPGPVKSSENYTLAFEEGVRRILKVCEKNKMKILHQEKFSLFTGNEFYAVLEGEAEIIKQALMPVEEADSLGRLFDIDVIKTDGTKVSRSDVGLDERKCFICGNDAHSCARNRTHSVDELLLAINDVIEQWKKFMGRTIANSI